jgi:hypothetical protein
MTAEGDQLDQSSIRAESTRLKSVAWAAFYRFKLTSPDQQLTDLAARAVEEALDVADASDKVDLSANTTNIYSPRLAGVQFLRLAALSLINEAGSPVRL